MTLFSISPGTTEAEIKIVISTPNIEIAVGRHSDTSSRLARPDVERMAGGQIVAVLVTEPRFRRGKDGGTAKKRRSAPRRGQKKMTTVGLF